MALVDDLERIASAAQSGDDRVTGVLAAELLDGSRVYLCSFASGAWLALDDDAQPIRSLRTVRDAASLAALCEVADELAENEGGEPRLATTEYLDRVGAPFGAALESAFPSVQALAAEVVARHATPLA